MSDVAASSSAAAPMRLCYRHSDTQATQVCARCRRPVCDGCSTLNARMQTSCPSCIDADARGSRNVFVVSLAVIAVVAAGGLYWLQGRPRTVTYGEDAPAIESAAARVHNTPCDGQSNLDLARLLNKAHDFPRVVSVVEAFDAACKPAPRLWWESFNARFEMQDFVGAVADASRLIEDDPDDGDFRWWRGRARREQGDLDGAAVDFEKAVALAGHKAFYSVIDLADLRERQHRACDAVPALATLLRDQAKDAKAAHIDARLARLIHDTPCPDALAAMPEKGPVAAVCASLPQTLQFSTTSVAGFDSSLKNLWEARTRPVAAAPAVACETMIEQTDGKDTLLDGTGMLSWHGRLACAGRPSVTATVLHISALHAQEELARKLVDAAIRDTCVRR